ncbi:hypothetical protein FEF34_28705 [Streptomyces marianii]|uniref:Secreted protein n=1 Tax=Streptomyces marianii TaxID=1817406 RepID=A0A5R9EEG0_9ACTN|nr:hypothetical protein [Streptomyces marianii]TLQ46424.1 hypothetical protein FEF34_28705 [Streptomyces marianii]
MSRKKTLSGKKKIALMIGATALVGGTVIVMTGTSNASAACDGLAQAVRNNENFIAGQRANPDAQSEARIANREAVIRQINLQQEAAGCAKGSGGGDQAAASAQPPADGGQAAGGTGAGGDAAGEVVCAGQNLTFSNDGGAPAASSGQFPIGTQLKVTNLANDKTTTVEVTSTSGSCALLNAAAFEQVREAGKNVIREVRIERLGAGGGGEAAEPPAAEQPPADQAGGGDQSGAAGEVVCAGSTVTLSGEGGDPAASSGQFPVGTRLKVTNLDNDKSTTVEVTSTSGSCALLNNAAFEQVREPGKFLIRNARIERVG